MCVTMLISVAVSIYLSMRIGKTNKVYSESLSLKKNQKQDAKLLVLVFYLGLAARRVHDSALYHA